MDGKREGTPGVYKGVRMRSQLEICWAMWFDSKNIRWEYEPKVCDQHGNPYYYLPDFLLDHGEGLGTGGYIEIKPTEKHFRSEFVNRHLDFCWRMHGLIGYPIDIVQLAYMDPDDTEQWWVEFVHLDNLVSRMDATPDW